MLYHRLIPMFFLVSSIFAQVRVYSTVDDNRITLNETINFKVVAEGSSGYPQVDITQIKDFTIISGPAQSSSYQWINGQMSSTKSLSWTLLPNRTGSLTIPSLKCVVDGEKQTLKPITITVLKTRQEKKTKRKKRAETVEETPILFLDVKVNKNEAFQGEQITAYYKLYSRVNLRQYSVEKKPECVGFWQEELSVPRQPRFRETSVKGVRYQVATLSKVALFPTRSGELVLDPMVLNCTYEVPSKTRRSPFNFDFFSDSFFTQTANQIVRSVPVKFKIKPIPIEGRPDNYTGAVGKFSLMSDIDTVVTETNQAISYIIELEGTGNFNLFELAEPLFPEGLDVYEPKVTFQKGFRDEISGVKSWEYIIIPRRDGRFLIPQSELSYFDPASGKWKQASTKVIELTVQPSKERFITSSGLTKDEIVLLESDIRHIRSSSIRFKSVSQGSVPAFVIWMNLIAIMLFGGPKVVGTLRAQWNRDPVKVRARGALARTRKRLLKIHTSESYDQVASALYDYVGDKINIASANLAPDSVKKLLDGRISSEKVNRLVEIVATCEKGRFSPEALPEETSAVSLAKEVMVLLKEINSNL